MIAAGQFLGSTGGVVALVAAILGAVGLLAAAAAVVRASSVKANLELLRGEVADLTASNARLSGENTQLTQEVSVLRELVTSRADIDRLVTRLDGLQAAIRADYQATLAVLLTRGGHLEPRRADA